MKRELLLGCGTDTKKKIFFDGQTEWENLTTLDMRGNPNIHFDLSRLAGGDMLPIEDETFDEVHAIHVLEHTGRQGDVEGFFREFAEYHRILKPGGFLCAICPSYRSMWAWGDPGHTRVLTSGTVSFLSQREYAEQVGKLPMSDYRDLWKRDFEPAYLDEGDEFFTFVLVKR